MEESFTVNIPSCPHFLTTDLLTYLTYLPTYQPTYLHTYLSTYIHTYLPTYLLTYLPTYLPTYIPSYLLTYLHTYLTTYLPTYIPFYLPTYIQYLLPRSIDPFTASFPRVLLATIPRYSRSMPFFYQEKFAVRLQSCRGKVYLGKTSVMKMTRSTLNRLLFPLCFSLSTSDDKIAPKNITDASKLVDLSKKNERT